MTARKHRKKLKLEQAKEGLVDGLTKVVSIVYVIYSLVPGVSFNLGDSLYKPDAP